MWSTFQSTAQWQCSLKQNNQLNSRTDNSKESAAELLFLDGELDQDI